MTASEVLEFRSIDSFGCKDSTGHVVGPHFVLMLKSSCLGEPESGNAAILVKSEEYGQNAEERKSGSEYTASHRCGGVKIDGASDVGNLGREADNSLGLHLFINLINNY